MKKQSDLKRKEQEFEEGDWVYLGLQPYQQNSVTHRRNLKLAPRFFGPFRVTQRVGSVAYK